MSKTYKLARAYKIVESRVNETQTPLQERPVFLCSDGESHWLSVGVPLRAKYGVICWNGHCASDKLVGFTYINDERVNVVISMEESE